ncbi:unnamed protein product [Peniophora sp. CBMAI 1063]|nr:unnamed protein product [Peniophora sp. CBMAI 1063]
MAATRQRKTSVSPLKLNRYHEQPAVIASVYESDSDASTLFLVHDDTPKTPVAPRFTPRSSKFPRHPNPRSPPAPPIVNHTTAYGQVRQASAGDPVRPPPSTRRTAPTARRGSLASSRPPMQRCQPGPFVELSVLNRGATGTTSAYEDRATGRVICLKVCNKKAADEDKYVAGSLQREIAAYKVVSKAPSPFVLQMHGAFQDFEFVYFAFDLQKYSMWDRVHGGVTVPQADSRRWVAQVALGIQYLHDIGLIHRDLKPANILITPNNDALIGDLGCAYICESGIVRVGNRYTKDFLYTDGYCSPEVDALEYWGGAYGPEVDWWGLGCVMYQLATGWPPFEGELLREYMKAERDGEGYIWLKNGLPEEITKEEVECIYGLLQLGPFERWSLKQLKGHRYFDANYLSDIRPFADSFTHARHRANSIANPRLYRPEPAHYRQLIKECANDEGRDLLASTLKTIQTYDKYDAASAAFYSPLAWINETSIWTVHDPHEPPKPLGIECESDASSTDESDTGMSDVLMSDYN